jgi:hypothetical protein
MMVSLLVYVDVELLRVTIIILVFYQARQLHTLLEKNAAKIRAAVPTLMELKHFLIIAATPRNSLSTFTLESFY